MMDFLNENANSIKMQNEMQLEINISFYNIFIDIDFMCDEEETIETFVSMKDRLFITTTNVINIY